ncbi:SANT/Myb-like DNA-binding domain-containing protein [Amaricoccus solimangrovi]|uniref:Myb-like domain-containing protein n=1 Tax=Amaricoccus solimangrovi TaxID=2589815 RepID=A0A501WFI3_9RHOB|nr:SANT/Myb-like DNA-binding domain-containing protein [Amaricoccus solimangrovi]TPE47245.1 hypothetical protein FJM51_20540 [Amaricoccus solimangrovi]
MDSAPVFPDQDETGSSGAAGESATEGSGAAAAEVPVSPPSSAAAPRKSAPGIEPESWEPLVARVLAGEKESDVAHDTGVKFARLRGKVMAAKNLARKAASAAPEPADEPEPPAPSGAVEEAEAQAIDAIPQNSEPESSIMPSGLAGPDVAPASSAPAKVVDPHTYAETQRRAALGDGGWSPAEDVTILRGLALGENTWKISQKLPGRKPADIVNRFNTLVPVRGSAAQAEALRRAEARLAEAGRTAAE